MKGIMLNIVFKLVLGLHLSAHLVSAAAKGAEGASTTTTTTTAKPVDLSGAATYQTSVRLLRPGESVSRSVSYSQSSQKYEQQNPGYDKGRYEEQRAQYEKEPGPREEYYKGNEEDNYGQYGQRKQELHHSQPNDYSNSYEGPYQQQHHGNYEEPPAQGNNYRHSNPSDGKERAPYTPQDYVKEDQYEQTKEEKGYEAGRPPFHYAYEVSSHPQQDNYDGSNNAEKSYGLGEKESYSPNVQQQGEYYPKPIPTTYVLQDVQKDDGYRQKETYFPAIPKEAGYAPNGQKEPGYLHSLPNEHSYPKQAGYSPRDSETAGFLPILPKEKSAAHSQDGKVSVYIKHLGHKTPGTNQYVHKERQGFLLLPVVQDKVEEKLRELKGQHKQEYRQSYQNDQTNHRQRTVTEKEVYVQPKTIQYPVNAKIHHGPSYSLDQASLKPEIRTIVNHGSTGELRSAIKSTVFANSQYESPKGYTYSVDDTPDEGPAPYLPQTVGDYEVPGINAYSRGSLLYGGPHTVISSVSNPAKYESTSLYGKTPRYTSPYDVTTAHKSVPVKVKDPRASTYASLSHSVGYPRIVDHPTTSNKAKKVNHGYGSQYKNPGSPLTTAYEHPTLDAGKPVSIFLQKPKEPEVVAFRPTSYSSKGRISAKSLVEDFGLHDYESFLSKPRQSGGAGSLHYDLHSFPAHRSYARFGYRRSGILARRPSL